MSVRGVLGGVLAIALCGLLATPAYADAEPLRQPHRVAKEVAGVTDLGVPAPPPSVKPAGMPPLVKGKAFAVNAGASPRMVAGAEAFTPTCVPYISKYLEPNPAGPGTVRVDYLTEIVCNFYLNGYGLPYLYDRTDGATDNGAIINVGTGFLFGNDYYGYGFGSVVLDGNVNDGVRQLEVAFDLALRTIDGTIWGGCYAPLPDGQRYLSTCDGIGTNTLYVTVGSNIFNSNLPPFNPAATIRDRSAFTLLTVHVGGGSDPASTARQNIVDAAAGLPAKTSTFSDVGATNVYLDYTMLKSMVFLYARYGYTMEVTAIAGSDHGTDSRHYIGKAFDVDFINGVKVTASNPHIANFKAACRNLGATEILGPGDDAAHATHVHCAWPR